MALPKILQYMQDVSGLAAGSLLKYDGSKLVKAVDGTDYITAETGTTNGWDWAKYSDGRAECHIKTSYTGLVNKAWGNLYESEGFVMPAYPFAFKTLPNAIITSVDGCFVELMHNGTATTPGGAYIIRPDQVAGSRQWYYNISAFGRWK